MQIVLCIDWQCCCPQVLQCYVNVSQKIDVARIAELLRSPRRRGKVQCRLYLHWGPGHPQPNGALARKYLPGFPFSWSLQRLRQKTSSIYCTVISKLTIYALLVFVRSCSSINNKIISFKHKIYLTTASWGPWKRKKSGGPGHVPSVPIG